MNGVNGMRIGTFGKAIGAVTAGWIFMASAVGSVTDSIDDPTTERLSFKVFLNDREIGYHDFTFRSAPSGQTVESEARFKVKLLFINAFKYQHQNVERWADGCLVEISARTDNNGKDLAVQGAATADRFVVDSSQGTEELSGCVQSFAYWNSSLRDAKRLLNSQTGEYLDVEVTDLGTDELLIDGQELTVERLRLTAKDTDIEICYDAQTGEWVALDSRLKKGRVLSYRRAPSDLSRT